MTPVADSLRLAILISGRGNNMVAIAKACQSAQIAARVATVISDVSDAAGLMRARELGLNSEAIPARDYRRDDQPDRETFESALIQSIDASGAQLIALAGFMRILSADFVARYAGRLLNIHPSLLPDYKGLHTHARVLQAREKQHGASVHYVTAELDGGPLILQARVPVLPKDDVADLSARVHARELMIYPLAIEWIAAGRLQWNGGQPVLDGVPLSRPIRYAGV
jgi:phosphoribosylglycinamide formyltransferase 1